MSITGWIVERLAVQNANKVLERFGLDKLLVRIFPSLKDKAKVLKLGIQTFGFLNVIGQASRELSQLTMSAEADDTVAVRRITVLFNRVGGNGSYELAAYATPRQMHKGENLWLPLLHWRHDVGTFWGDVTSITERVVLDRLNEEERQEYLRRVLFSAGAYYCEIVVLHDKGETRSHFTVLNPAGRGKPGIVCPADHCEYDANRLIPAQGGFYAG